MADKRRFDLFAAAIVAHFDAARIYDVAGGMGRLSQALAGLGRSVLTFDRRHKHLDVAYALRDFSLDEPCACELVVGMHPDGATRVIIEYAARHRIPFAVVPCCSDNGMSYKPWVRHLTDLAQTRGFAVQEVLLDMPGRNRVLLGRPAEVRREG
jgi:hypothetical protein